MSDPTSQTRPVVFFTSSPVWSMGKGSGASSMARTIDTYVQAGCDVTLITTRQEPELRASDELRVITISPRLDRLRSRFPRLGAVLAESIEFPLRAPLRARRVKAQSGDDGVLYGYEIAGALAARTTQRALRWRWPLVTRFQGVIVHQEVRARQWRRLLLRLNHLAAFRIPSDLCIMTNDGTRGDQVLQVMGNRPKRVLFMINGVDPVQEQAAMPPPPPLRLITASRLVAWKRVDRALHILRAILDLGVDCHLTVLGDGEDRDELIRLAETLELSDHVEFAGRVPNESVGRHIRSSHFLLTVHDVSNLANPVFEALRSGVPVASLADGSLDGIVADGRNGVLAEVGDSVASLARRLVEAANDEAVWSALCERARETGRGLPTWEDRLAAERAIVLHSLHDRAN